uniref:ABC transporter permease n=1 Tax=Olsenella timonensis TaxID=1805478 RepID=UPI00094EAE9B|nr:FtsX-like permease family protein [Olsenella timonensis]
MQLIFLRRALRALARHAARYGALLALVAACAFMVTGIVGSSLSVVSAVEESAAAHGVEDGQIAVTSWLPDDVERALTRRGVELERQPSMDFEAEGDGSGSGDVLRVYPVRESIDTLAIEEGRAPASDGEAAVDRRWAEENGVGVGDEVRLGGRALTVCGVGTKPDYDCCLRDVADPYADSGTFGTAFVSAGTYEGLRGSGEALASESLRYAYRFVPSEGGVAEGDAIEDAADLRGALADDASSAPLATGVLEASDNPRIGASIDDVRQNVAVGLFAGVLVFALVAYTVSVFVVHGIDSERRQVGALRAMGAGRWGLCASYAALPVLVALLGGVAGTVLGTSPVGLLVGAASARGYYSIPPVSMTVFPAVVAYGVAMPPAVAAVVAIAAVSGRLRGGALALLRGEDGRGGTLRGRAKVGRRMGRLGFKASFALRELRAGARGVVAVLAGVFVSLLVLTLAFDCAALVSGAAGEVSEEVAYSDRYQLAGPLPGGVPDGAEEAVGEQFTVRRGGMSFTVDLLGVREGSEFFPETSASRPDEASVSDVAAQKLGLSVGDELVLDAGATGHAYRLTVVEVVPYASGITCFMDIDALRELMGLGDGYYNALFSEGDLDLPASADTAHITKADLERAAGVVSSVMEPLVVVLSALSMVILSVVLYLMTKAMLDQATPSISLLRVFGYTPREIRGFYLDGPLAAVALGAPVAMAAAKALVDAAYPSLISNVAMRCDVSWPAWAYPLIWCAVMGLFLVVRTLHLRSIARVSPAEIVRAR